MLKAKITLPEEAPAPPADAVTDNRTDYQKRFGQGRKEAGLTLQELGDAVGMSPQAVSQFERGKDSISLVNFLAAVAAMGLRVEWVLTGRGRMWEKNPPAKQEPRKRAAARKPQPEAPK
jgi:transcriptional regulator with XRE-family HTH domain